MMPTVVKEQAPVPPPSYQRALRTFIERGIPDEDSRRDGRQHQRAREGLTDLNGLAVLLAQDLLVKLTYTGLLQGVHKSNIWHRPC